MTHLLLSHNTLAVTSKASDMMNKELIQSYLEGLGITEYKLLTSTPVTGGFVTDVYGVTLNSI